MDCWVMDLANGTVAAWLHNQSADRMEPCTPSQHEFAEGHTDSRLTGC